MKTNLMKDREVVGSTARRSSLYTVQ